MKPSDLFNHRLEPELTQWLSAKGSLSEAMQSLGDFFVNLRANNVLGNLEVGSSVFGPVHIGEGAVVRANAIIRGPVILGENVVVESGAYIGPYTMICPNCIIGFGCLIQKALLLNDSMIGPGTFIANTIVGASVNIGTRSTIGAIPVRADDNSSFATEPTAIRDNSILPSASTVGPGAIFS